MKQNQYTAVAETRNLEKTRGQKLKDIAENILLLENSLEAEEKSLEVNHEKETCELNKSIEEVNERLEEKQKQKREVFSQIQTQRRKDLAERQNDSKILLQQGYKKKMTDIEEKLALTFPTTKASPPTPECPVCLDPMAPPARIFSCPNGHLVCEICKEKMEKVICALCYEPIMGRATAMEQMLRTLYNQV